MAPPIGFFIIAGLLMVFLYMMTVTGATFSNTIRYAGASPLTGWQIALAARFPFLAPLMFIPSDGAAAATLLLEGTLGQGQQYVPYVIQYLRKNPGDPWMYAYYYAVYRSATGGYPGLQADPNDPNHPDRYLPTSTYQVPAGMEKYAPGSVPPPESFEQEMQSAFNFVTTWVMPIAQFAPMLMMFAG